MNKSTRVVNYFCVIGTGSKLVPQNTEYQKQRTLTQVEIQIGSISEDIPIRENEKWIDLLGNKQVWLRCIFDQKGQPITTLSIMELTVEDGEIKIPLAEDVQPIPVKRKFDSSLHQFKGINQGFSLYSGFYDLTQFAEYKTKNNHHLVMCYQTQSQINYCQPICDGQIILADKIDKKKYTSAFSDMRLIIPKDFHALQFPWAGNRFLIYKRSKLLLKLEQSPYKTPYMPKIIDRYPQEDHYDSPLTHMVPMIPMVTLYTKQFCFPQGIIIEKGTIDPISKGQQVFNFILTSETGKRTYCTCLIFHELAPNEILEQLGHIEKQQFISYPKALCLLSPYNYPEQMKELVKYIYRCSLSKNNIPIETTICNIINKIKFPPQAWEIENVCLKYVLPSQDVYFYTNYKYPVGQNEALECLFRLLDVNRIINIYVAILLEKKIHFISNHPAVPGLVIDAFLQLLFPFQFTSILIPVLPDSLRSYIEAPVPFMIGYSQKNIVEQHQPTQSDSIYAYLDTNFVVNSENLVLFPEKVMKKLKSNLKQYSKLFNDDYSKSYLKRVDQAYHIYMDDQNYDPEEGKHIDWFGIRNAFLDCNAHLLKGYRKYLIKNSKVDGDFTEQFHVKDFQEHWKKDKFIQQFMETRIFQYFIQERSKFSENESCYQFFDKFIDKKDIQLKHIPPSRVIEILVPEEDGKSNRTHAYDRFPQLNQQLMQFDYSDMQDLKQEINDDIPQMDSARWAKYLLETIYRIWFIFFIVRVRNNQENRVFEQLTDLAITILEDMKDKHLNLTEKLFRYVLESCGYFQMDEKALYLVKFMKDIKIEASPATHGIYFQAVAQAMNQKGLPGEQNQEHLEQIDLLQRGDSQNPYGNSNFSLHTLCTNCRRKLYFEEVLDSYRKNYYNNSIECSKNFSGCGQEFIPKMQFTLYQDENPIEAELYEIYNPIQIVRELENIIRIKGETFLLGELFEKQYKSLFVNILFYIKLIKLPYFHIIRVNEYIQFTSEIEKTKNRLQQKSQSSIFARVAQEFDHYRGKLQQGDSSGNSSSTRCKQEDSTHINYGSKYMKKLFSSLITDLFPLISKQHSTHNFQSLQQFDETKAESPK